MMHMTEPGWGIVLILAPLLAVCLILIVEKKR